MSTDNVKNNCTLTPLNLNRLVLLTDGTLNCDVYLGTHYSNGWMPKTQAATWRFLKKKTTKLLENVYDFIIQYKFALPKLLW